jgi:hypothetical protein
MNDKIVFYLIGIFIIVLFVFIIKKNFLAKKNCESCEKNCVLKK